MTFQNYYEILGLSANSTIEDIKQAYKQKVLQYHPDKNPNIDTTEEFRKIQTAYEILSNKQKRQKYDAFESTHDLHVLELYQYFMDICLDLFIRWDINTKDQELFFNTFDFKEFEDDLKNNNMKEVHDKIYQKIIITIPYIFANNWLKIITSLI